MYFFQFIALPFMRPRVLTLLLALLFSSAMAQTTSQSPEVKSAPAAAKSAFATPVDPVILARGPAGAVISSDDVRAELRRAPAAERQSVLSKPDVVQQIASNLLTRRVLSAEAERDGLGRDPIIAAALSLARDRILSDALLARIDAQNTPSDAALDAYARNVIPLGANGVRIGYAFTPTGFHRIAQG